MNTTSRVSALIERYDALEVQLEAYQERCAVLGHAYATVDNSKFARLRTLLLLVKSIIGIGGGDWFSSSSDRPDDTVIVKATTLTVPAEAAELDPPGVDPYESWRRRNDPTSGDLTHQRGVTHSYSPLISIVMPTYNSDEAFLVQAIDSVLAQTYARWELCVADDCSTNPRVLQILRSFERRDPRIHVVARAENGHISAASNSALAICSGEFVGLLDHDDMLAPNALFEYVSVLNRLPDTDMIYSDEDKLSSTNVRYQPFFKPDWAPDAFLSKMYTCHFGMYRRALLDEIGGFRLGFEGSQDYDLVLRVTERTARIEHVAKILYHWRVHELSAASGTGVKPYAYISAQKALNEALERRGERGRIFHVTNSPGLYIPRYDLTARERVSIVIPSRDRAVDLDRCLTSIFATSTYMDIDVVLVDNGTVEPEARSVIEHWSRWEPSRFSVVRADIPFNFSTLINLGVSAATGTYVVLLNNDTAVQTPDWIEAMLEQCQRPSIGAVGVKLLFPDRTIQHAGIVLGLGGAAGHGHYRFPGDADGYFGALKTVNNYSAVTAACLMVKRSDFDRVGGFDEALSIAYNDVDFCLKLGRLGLRHVYLPHVEVIHYESASRGSDLSTEQAERNLIEQELLIERWDIRNRPDPAYNVNLALTHPDFRIAATPGHRAVYRQEKWLREHAQAQNGSALVATG